MKTEIINRAIYVDGRTLTKDYVPICVYCKKSESCDELDKKGVLLVRMTYIYDQKRKDLLNMATKIDDFIKRVKSTAEEDLFTPRIFYYISEPMFDEMCELLKEQEAVKPIPPTDESDLWRCGNCYHQLFRCIHQKYCEVCGRLVKWE